MSIVAGVWQDEEDAERQAEELQLGQESRQDVRDEGPRHVQVLLVGASVTPGTDTHMTSGRGVSPKVREVA